MNKKYLSLTTTLPYVNSSPHVGFALEIVQADVVARLKTILGYNVFFNFGTDEHGLKIYRKAQEQNKDPQDYVDEYAKKFDKLKIALNLSYNNFIRTTDPHHIKAAQEFWQKCKTNGDIYKKLYKTKYCVGCELEKTDSELENSRCPLHPNNELEIVEEENYFFRFSKYQKPLLKFYEKTPKFVIPGFRFNEIKTFVRGGLQDFSISRLKDKMPWGIDVPDDPKQVMSVWFDALVNYVSAMGWPDDLAKFEKWWPVIQFAGKDNLRQQTAIWQAMLMSAGLPNSKQIYIHGFITSGGQKISKSLGNVIDPFALAKKYGTDALRYHLLAKIHPFEDSDFTIEKFEETYNADLANGLGNLVSRVARLCENSELNFNSTVPIQRVDKEIKENINEFRFDEAIKVIFEKYVSALDQKINKDEPWKLQGKDLEIFLKDAVSKIRTIIFNLSPFLPKTAEKIEKQFKGPKIKSAEPLFPRLK